MKFGYRCILAHYPRVGVAHFLHRIGCQSRQVWIPLLCSGIPPRDALAHLYQRLLYVSRLLRVVQIFVQLLVRELTAEPSIPPEQKGHEADEPRRQKKEK